MEPQNGPMKLYDILEGYARWSIATGPGVDGLALVGRAMYFRKQTEVGYQCSNIPTVRHLHLGAN